jgi:hypothetical protein
MVVSKGEPPEKPRPPLPSAARQRPVSPAPGNYSNRPILLQPRGDLPDPDEDDDLDDDTDLREVLRNSPAWLVSTILHMLILISMGIWAYSIRSQEQELTVVVSYAEQIGDQLLDPSALDEGVNLDTVDDQLITPVDLAPVPDPLALPPELANIDLNLPPTTASVENRPVAAPIGLALKGRQAGTRLSLLKRFGGTAETEAAVNAGLAWLARQQREDGTWSLTGPYTKGAPQENTAAATAMALLAFQGHGETHLDGTYSEQVKRGMDAMLAMQRPDGQFLGKMTADIHLLYTHAQCTIAVCELYGMTKDPNLLEPAKKAIQFAAAAQDPKLGGWRYRPRVDSDTSVTGWFVMAFQSARMAQIPIPSGVLPRVSAYLDTVQINDGRGYRYQIGHEFSNAVCAEGLLCRQYLGWRQNDPRLVEGIGELVRTSPIAYGKDVLQDVYYWYYCTQAAHHMEGTLWDEWNGVMRQVVPEKQIKDGPEAGSWDPQGDRYSYCGRLYTTCLSIYMLEVYYRHLPIYSGYQFDDELGKTMLPPEADLETEPSNTPEDAASSDETPDADSHQP